MDGWMVIFEFTLADKEDSFILGHGFVPGIFQMDAQPNELGPGFGALLALNCHHAGGFVACSSQ
jgi:hypothetical protein